jgi:hypothetical protein
MYDILEDDRVNVLTHQVDEEPITNVGLANDHFDTLPLDPAIPEHRGVMVQNQLKLDQNQDFNNRIPKTNVV